MKILYVETMVLGHHEPYVHALTNSNLYDSVVITPEQIKSVESHQIIHAAISFDAKSFKDYMSNIKYIGKIAQKENVDAIHFLDGDKIMRYFGYGLKRLSRKYPVVITFHHLFEGAVRAMSYRLMCRNRIAVVHTTEFQNRLRAYGIIDVEHIEYPSFLQVTTVRKQNDVPVIGMFGGTRLDKGLDILIEALKSVTAPYKLLIAGREADFSREQIEEMCKPIREKVEMDLRFLSEEELNEYWNQVDFVVLPYRKIFDGASGQLTEGVNRGLPIIGPSHGSLGNIINENHLGYTFDSENTDALTKVIQYMLTSHFEYDEVARAYQRYLSPARFCDEYYQVYSQIVKAE